MSEYKPTERDADMVDTLAGYGIPQDQIARLIGVSAPTLRKYYAEAFATGKARANALVAANLFRMATGDGKSAAPCAMFWLKTQAGWREVAQDVNVNLTTSDKSPEDRARAMALVMAKAAQQNGRPH